MSVQETLNAQMKQELVNIPPSLVFNLPATNRIIRDRRTVYLDPENAKRDLTVDSSGKTVSFLLGGRGYLDINSFRFNFKFLNGDGVGGNATNQIKAPGLSNIIHALETSNNAGVQIDKLDNYNIFASMMALSTMEDQYFDNWGQLEGISLKDAGGDVLDSMSGKYHSIHLFYGLFSANSNKKALPLQYDNIRLTIHLENPNRCMYDASNDVAYRLEDMRLTYDVYDVDPQYEEALNQYMMANPQTGLPIHYESFINHHHAVTAGANVYYMSRPIKSAKSVFCVFASNVNDKTERHTFTRFPAGLKTYQFQIGNQMRPQFRLTENDKHLKFVEFKKALHMSNDVHTQGKLDYDRYGLLAEVDGTNLGTNPTINDPDTTEVIQTFYGLDLERTVEDLVNGHTMLGTTDVKIDCEIATEFSITEAGTNSINVNIPTNFQLHWFVLHDSVLGLRPREVGGSYVLR